jgi:hypothetical protein
MGKCDFDVTKRRRAAASCGQGSTTAISTVRQGSIQKKRS